MEDELIGQTIAGRYLVLERLGSGGMGSVFRVQHLESLQPFALKVLHPEIAENARAAVRLLREARATASLRSRHVVRVIDSQVGYVHENRPLPFLVMELLSGVTLKDLSERVRLRPGEVSWVFGQLARALGTAHDQGIVHRDLKPSNVFLARGEDDELVVKLCDFGMAKSVHGVRPDESETRSGEVFGTPLYMAPEQLRDSKHVDARADQWALGLVAFRLLTGRDYFAGASTSADLVVAILSAPMQDPSRSFPELPRAFDEWFRTATHRDRDRRFSDVREQARALEKALGAPIPLDVTEATLAHPSAEGRSEPIPLGRVRAGEATLEPAISATALASTAGLPWYATLPTSWIAASAVGLIAISWLMVRPLPASEHSRWIASGSMTAPLASAVEEARHGLFSAEPEELVPEVPPVLPSPLPASAGATKRISQSAPPKRKPKSNPKPNPKPLPPPVVDAPVAKPAPPPPKLRPRGATCERSAQCESGLCFAEQCR